MIEKLLDDPNYPSGKKELFELIYFMYQRLDYDLRELQLKGNGRIIHDLNSARTPICGHLSLMEQQIKEDPLPEKVNFEYLDLLLFQYMRSQEKLKIIYQKLYGK